MRANRNQANNGIREILTRFDTIVQDGVISAEEVEAGGGTQDFIQAWRQIPENEREKLYEHLDDGAKSKVMLDLIGSGALNTPSKRRLHALRLLFDSDVEEANCWQAQRKHYNGLVRAFEFLVNRIEKKHPQLTLFIQTTLQKADVEDSWLEAVENILKPAAEYTSDYLKSIT